MTETTGSPSDDGTILQLRANRKEIVRAALIAHLDILTKLQKRLVALNVTSEPIEAMLADTKDMLAVLGWKPKGAPAVDPRQTKLALEGKESAAPAKGTKAFDVTCPDCSEKFKARGTEATCPKCATEYNLLTDELDKVVRLVRKAKRGSKK